MKKYFDPEYNRIIDESVTREQYEYFVSQCIWFNKNYEQFLADNFRPLRTYLVYSEEGDFVYDTNDLSEAKDRIYEFGGKVVETVTGNVIKAIGV